MRLLLATFTLLAVLLMLVEARPSTPTRTNEEVRTVIRARQWNPREPRRLSVWRRGPPGSPDSCPAAPMPTVGCGSCTSCYDASPPYCASASSDPKSCGTCRTTMRMCQAGVGQVATCKAGACGVECDNANGWFGPSDACSKNKNLAYLKCALKQGQHSLQTESLSVYASTDGSSQVYCVYSKSSGSSITCAYDTGTGKALSGQSTSCPNSAISTTSGSSCLSYNACPDTYTSGRLKSSLSSSQNTISLNSSGGLSVSGLACTFGSGITQQTCTYDTTSRKVVTASGYSSQTSTCPPLQTDQAAYCLQ